MYTMYSLYMTNDAAPDDLHDRGSRPDLPGYQAHRHQMDRRRPPQGLYHPRLQAPPRLRRVPPRFMRSSRSRATTSVLRPRILIVDDDLDLLELLKDALHDRLRRGRGVHRARRGLAACRIPADVDPAGHPSAGSFGPAGLPPFPGLQESAKGTDTDHVGLRREIDPVEVRRMRRRRVPSQAAAA